MDNRLLDKKQFAAAFRVSTRTVDRWVARGWLRKVVIGRVVRFRAEDGQALLRRGLTGVE